MAKKDSLSRAAEILGSIDKHKKESAQQAEKDRQNMIFSIGQGVADALKPTLNQLASQARLTKADMADFVSKIKVETHTPDVIMPEINVPKSEITVRSPKVRIPDVIMPDKMNIEGFVSLMGVDLGNPLPVQLRLPDGNPLNLMEGLSQIVTGGGGGGVRSVKINNTSGNPVPVTGTFSVSTSATTASVPTNNEGLTYNSDNPLPVTITSGASATTATNIVDSTGVAYTGSNPVPISGSVTATGGGYLTDTELRATAVPVSGTVTATPSGTQDVDVTANSIGLATEATLATIDADTSTLAGAVAAGQMQVDIVADGAGLALAANQLADGHNVTVDNGAAGAAVNIQDGGNSITVDGTVAVSGITGTTGVNLVDSSGVAYSGSNRVPTRNIQARGSLATAYASVTTGTETTLLAGAASTYHDLVWVMGANHSDSAVTADIRSTTGGNVLMSLEVPANSTAGIAPAVPYPAADVGASWTVDLSDDTHDLDVTALFSKEV